MDNWFTNPYAIPGWAFLFLWGFLIVMFIVVMIVSVIRGIRHRDGED